MIPTISTDTAQPTHADDCRPRFFVDDTYDAGTDADWWLDIGLVDLPAAPGV